MLAKKMMVLYTGGFLSLISCVSTKDRRRDPASPTIPENDELTLEPSEKDQQAKDPRSQGGKNDPSQGGNGNQKAPGSPSLDLPPGTKIEQVGPVYGGMATHFEALGNPTGGCGIPTELLDTPDFVALNVQHTPGDYTSHFARPIIGRPPEVVGDWNNGLNCGRWVMVTIGDRCQGLNDGLPGKGFCREGGEKPWVADRFNGALLPMVIADSCQDGNGWCRDDRHHLDLATASLDRFKKNGQSVGPLLPDHWGNRKISWHYMKAPLYSGDIKIHFALNSSSFWSAVIITHLENGIHGMKVRVGQEWQDATMVGDNGQVYVLPPQANRPFQIKILDAQDQWVGGGTGRVYQFDFPSSCNPKCTAVYTTVGYGTMPTGSN